MPNAPVTASWAPYRILTSVPRTRLFHAVLFTALSLSLVLAVEIGLNDLALEGRVALSVFGTAVLAWCLTSIDATYIAVIAALVPSVIGVEEPGAFFGMLGNAMLWLLLAAFVVAAAFSRSGMAARLAFMVLRGRTTTLGLCVRLVGVITASALVVPATSGRAALFLPVFEALKDSIRDARILRTLALIIPVAILLSASASLIGAGAHLILVEMLVNMNGQGIGYLQWLIWGAPFAVVSCLLSVWIILQLFLNREERRRALTLSVPCTTGRAGITRDEWMVLGVAVTLVTLWISEPLHGLHTALVAVCGAALLTAPGFGVLTFKDALKAVNWSLLLLLAATIKLGSSLIDSGAAQWLIERIFGFVSGTPFAVAASVAAVSLLAHLVITSRSARASILVPMVLLVAVPAGLDPMALAFISTVAAGYCLTLPVSAKPLMMFSQLDGVYFGPSELLRLALWLIPLHLALLGLFTLMIWPLLGLELLASEAAPHPGINPLPPLD